MVTFFRKIQMENFKKMANSIPAANNKQLSHMKSGSLMLIIIIIIIIYT